MGGGICIIGSGFSAAVLLLHLDDKGFDCRHVTIIGRGELGTGQAFGCVHDDFRLNVRAELMRVWPDRPLEFTHWAKTRLTDDPDAASDAGDFYRRRDFAVYMAEQLNHRPGTQSASRIESEAVALTADDRRWQVTLDDGRTVSADQVVLATGNPSPDWPFRGPVIDAPTLVRVPWRGDWVDRVGGDERVVVIGSGLTAMDTIHVLHRRNHRGNITLVAPDGLLPPVQTDWHSADALAWPEPMRASDFLGFMRRHIGDGDWQDAEWQRRFESLRVYICEAWQRLAPLDQARLMRRVGWLWSLARFRAGPQATGSANALIKAGQLTIRRDIVTGLATTDAGQHIAGLGTGDSITADAVINCSGAGRDRLIAQLIDDKVIAPHQTAPHRPRMTNSLALVAPGNRPYDSLYAVGPVTAHHYGDILGAASISRQAAMLADHLMAKESIA